VFLNCFCVFLLRLANFGQGTKERINLSYRGMNFIIFPIQNVYKIGEGYLKQVEKCHQRPHGKGELMFV
jgi:hypothetical protein